MLLKNKQTTNLFSVHLYVALIICYVCPFYSGCSQVPACCIVNTDNWNKACTSVADSFGSKI